MDFHSTVKQNSYLAGNVGGVRVDCRVGSVAIEETQWQS